MFLRTASRIAARGLATAAPRHALRLLAQPAQKMAQPLALRALSTSLPRMASLDPTTMVEIEERVMTVLNCYDKVDPTKLTMTSHFMKDLELDSLDHVELIVAIENEFQIEVSDGDEETLMTPREICEYLADLWDVSE